MKSRSLVLVVTVAVWITIRIHPSLTAQERPTGADQSAAQVRPNPIPLINQPLLPDAVRPGGTAFTLTIYGTGFVPGSTVKWNGSPRPTKFVSSSQLAGSIFASDIAGAGTASVTIVNPAPGGGTSNVAFVEVTRPTSSLALSTTSVPIGGSSVAVVAGDFNGDSKLDLVVADATNNNLSVLLGRGDGTFHQTVENVGGLNPTAMAAGDFNGDGKLDLVVANLYDTVSILLGNGDGTFRAPTSYPTTGDTPSSVVVGDFNGDGKLDLVVTSSGARNGMSSVSVLLGNGNGTFQPALYHNAGFGSASVAVGDFNRDGKLDLAVVNFGDSDVSILLGNGDGTFQTGGQYAGNAPTWVAAGDFNGDGVLDLAITNIVTNSGLGNVSIFLGDGKGNFKHALDYGVGSNPYTVAIGDFNGDGKLDLAVANYGGYGNSSSVSVLLGNGNGTFSRAVDYNNQANYGTASIAIGDFKRDGRLDVVVGDAASNGTAISVMLQPPLVNGPDALVMSSALTFGTQLVGTTSAAQPIELTNYGTMTLSIADIGFTGGDPADFYQTNTCGSSVAPGASCTISVTFRPSQRGSRTTTLTISDNAPRNPQTVSVSGASTVVKLSPTSLSFACHRLCLPIQGCHYYCSVSGSTTLTNVGSTPLDITGIAISAGPFIQTNTCGTSVGAGKSCAITVTWLRKDGNGEISISDNGGGSPQTVSLSGFLSP